MRAFTLADFYAVEEEEDHTGAKAALPKAGGGLPLHGDRVAAANLVVARRVDDLRCQLCATHLCSRGARDAFLRHKVHKAATRDAVAVATRLAKSAWEALVACEQDGAMVPVRGGPGTDNPEKSLRRLDCTLDAVYAVVDRETWLSALTTVDAHRQSITKAVLVPLLAPEWTCTYESCEALTWIHTRFPRLGVMLTFEARVHVRDASGSCTPLAHGVLVRDAVMPLVWDDGSRTPKTDMSVPIRQTICTASDAVQWLQAVVAAMERGAHEEDPQQVLACVFTL
jgi:hypothetical protein